MDQMVLSVVYLDGTKRELTIQSSDIVKFETHFEIPVTKIAWFTHIAYLAWCATVRVKETAKTFDEWLESIDIVTEADPKDSQA